MNYFRKFCLKEASWLFFRGTRTWKFLNPQQCLCFFFFKQLGFLLNVLLKRFSQKDQSPCHHRTLQILLFASTFLSSAGAAVVDEAEPPAGPAQAAKAGPPAPTLQMRLLMLTLAKAFANKPGQKGSTFMPAALMRALILSCDHHLIVVQNEGRVDASELRDGGHGAGGCSVGLPGTVLVAGWSEGLTPKWP